MTALNPETQTLLGCGVPCTSTLLTLRVGGHSCHNLDACCAQGPGAPGSWLTG